MSSPRALPYWMFPKPSHHTEAPHKLKCGYFILFSVAMVRKTCLEKENTTYSRWTRGSKQEVDHFNQLFAWVFAWWGSKQVLRWGVQ